MNKGQIVGFGLIICVFFCFILVGFNFKNNTDENDGSSSVVQKSETETEFSIFPMDLNEISKEQLVEIDGIGEAYAQRIIDYRTEIGKFSNLEQLLNVSGIGEKTLEKLKNYLYVTDPVYEISTTSISEYETTTSATTTTTKPAISTTTTPKKTTTTKVKSTTTKATTTTTTTLTSQRKPVNLNTATFEEIKNNLLLTDEQAQSIIELREDISYFSNPLEVLYATKPNSNKYMFTNSQYNEFKDYLYV